MSKLTFKFYRVARDVNFIELRHWLEREVAEFPLKPVGIRLLDSLSAHTDKFYGVPCLPCCCLAVRARLACISGGTVRSSAASVFLSSRKTFVPDSVASKRH